MYILIFNDEYRYNSYVKFLFCIKDISSTLTLTIQTHIIPSSNKGVAY